MLCHIIGFGVVFICVFFLLERCFFNKCDILYSWYRVQDVEEDIDVLILGNSHAFTSTNAAVLEEAMNERGVNCEVFASSSQNMELTLVHLKTALKYKKPKYILLEVFSPILDNKATLVEGGPKGNLLMDLDGIHNYADKFSALCTLVDWKSMPEGMFQLCRPAHRWDRWNIKRNRSIKVSNTHGYEAASTAKSFATGTKRVEDIENACKAAYSNHELEELADYNRDALVEFLDITKQNDINVVLYKAPTMRDDDFGLVNEVFTIAKDYDNVVLCQDTRCDMLEMGLELEDFYDDGHLNKRGEKNLHIILEICFQLNSICLLTGIGFMHIKEKKLSAWLMDNLCIVWKITVQIHYINLNYIKKILLLKKLIFRKITIMYVK